MRPPDGCGFPALILAVDPDDLIFPRAATRVGPKYQVVVPSAPGSEPPPSTSGISKKIRCHAFVDSFAGLEERGGDSTIEVLSLVNEMSEDTGAWETSNFSLQIVSQRNGIEFVVRACECLVIGAFAEHHTHFLPKSKRTNPR